MSAPRYMACFNQYDVFKHCHLRDVLLLGQVSRMIQGSIAPFLSSELLRYLGYYENGQDLKGIMDAYTMMIAGAGVTAWIQGDDAASVTPLVFFGDRTTSMVAYLLDKGYVKAETTEIPIPASPPLLPLAYDFLIVASETLVREDPNGVKVIEIHKTRCSPQNIVPSFRCTAYYGGPFW
ncbi:hypothetical protein SISNIDRAFT_491889 [Sistotremastrum niveocremeum HHB9708]|uniref:Uncharacterized protein n=1 Tax=Sistotremastrum niveocremeum HHB9708 TaxID=1314777 RepID=A0A164M9N5_9AGAM|nr:hypothetical protein SISNIDRAFT_491889 [Sistotremastrum niveocremeum HHB9708]